MKIEYDYSHVCTYISGRNDERQMSKLVESATVRPSRLSPAERSVAWRSAVGHHVAYIVPFRHNAR